MMSFAAIAQAEGISPRTAEAQYRSAMRKLRERPQSLARLLILAQMLEAARRARQNGESDACFAGIAHPLSHR